MKSLPSDVTHFLQDNTLKRNSTSSLSALRLGSVPLHKSERAFTPDRTWHFCESWVWFENVEPITCQRRSRGMTIGETSERTQRVGGNESRADGPDVDQDEG